MSTRENADSMYPRGRGRSRSWQEEIFQISVSLLERLYGYKEGYLDTQIFAGSCPLCERLVKFYHPRNVSELFGKCNSILVYPVLEKLGEY